MHSQSPTLRTLEHILEHILGPTPELTSSRWRSILRKLISIIILMDTTPESGSRRRFTLTSHIYLVMDIMVMLMVMVMDTLTASMAVSTAASMAASMAALTTAALITTAALLTMAVTTILH